MPFRINYNDKRTWIAVTDGFNKKLKKKYIYSNMLDNSWTNFKIGYFLIKTKDGLKFLKTKN